MSVATDIENGDHAARVRELELRVAGMLDALYRDTGVTVLALYVTRQRQGGTGQEYSEVAAEL